MNQSSDRVNALARGLKVLAALNDLNDASVGDLARASGVAKTTVLRILKTLVHEGYVSRDAAEIYRVTDRVTALSRGLVGSDRRRAVVQPILDGLRDLRWPVEFLVVDHLSMVITLNNRARAPIKLSPLERRRFPMLESASGIAYLAALPTRARNERMRMAADEAGAGAEARLRAARRAVKQAGERGYAARDLTEILPGLRVAAVAVGRDAPHGALALIHFDDMVDANQIDKRLVPRMKRAADEIDDALSALQEEQSHDPG